jgi:hypothetical protein
MRSLASIQRVIDLQPIEGKERIELATVFVGWEIFLVLKLLIQNFY